MECVDRIGCSAPTISELSPLCAPCCLLSAPSHLSSEPVFVEALDKCFENVCELDLIFHSDKVRTRSLPFCFDVALV